MQAHFEKLFKEQLKTEYLEIKEGVINFPCPESSGADYDQGFKDEIDRVFKPHNMDHTMLVAQEYQQKLDYPIHYQKMAELIAKESGIILECASGPGAGFTPLILKFNGNAKIILNDISQWLLSDWHKLNQKLDFGRNICFARFDYADSPFKDNSIDCISSLAGISNIGRVIEAIHESYRILKPGGKLFMHDMMPSRETMNALPDSLIKELIGDGENAFLELIVNHGFEYYIKIAGFEIISSDKVCERDYNNNGDWIPEKIIKAGYDFKWAQYQIIANKPN